MTINPHVERAKRELRMALQQHTYAMRHGTPADTIHTAAEVGAARAKLRAVVEEQGRQQEGIHARG